MLRLRFTPLDREIARLAVPALGALVAEPLYVLADTAVVGHIGTDELAGLALASQVLLVAYSVFIFLAYGTTAAVARLMGAELHVDAARQAVQSLWLALVMGVLLGAAGYVFATPLLRVLGGEGAVLANARVYLQISVAGLPALLMTLAGVGYLRGLQDTVRPLLVAVVTATLNLVVELVLVFGLGFGIGASAASTVLAQWVAAALYLVWIRGAVAAHGVDLRPDIGIIGRLAVVGADLFVRTAALRGSFTVAVAVAARLGTVALAAHQIVGELWAFLALALDAIAIAAQAMVGRLLGAGDADAARHASRRMIEWGVVAGTVAMVVLLALRPVLPGLFSDDPAVVEVATFLFLFLALMQPLNGVVFALDGILIGAGDLRFLAWAMAATAAVFIPMAIGVAVADLGIGWLWAAFTLFMAMRCVLLVARFRSDAWLVVGASR